MTTEAIELTSSVAQPQEEPEKMASGIHGSLIMILGYYLMNHILPRNLGHVFDSSTTFNFNDGQPKRQPDVAFVSIEKLLHPDDSEVAVVPDLAVEIVSKNDLVYEVATKIKQYQAAGVKLIWVVYPINQTVQVYRLADGLKNQTLLVTDTLDGADVLPGFTLPLQQLFR